MILASLIFMVAGILLIARAKRWEGYLLTLASLLTFIIAVFQIVVPFWMKNAPEKDWARHFMVMQGIEYFLLILIGVAVLYITLFALKLYKSKHSKD